MCAASRSRRRIALTQRKRATGSLRRIKAGILFRADKSGHEAIDAEVNMNDVSLPHASAAELKAGAAAAYRDIAVHLDGTPEDEVRLAHAEALAVRFGGRLTGLFTNLLPNPASFAGDFGVTALGQLTDSAVAEGDVVERRLRQRLARIGSQQQLRRIETFPGLWKRPWRAKPGGTTFSSRHAPATTTPPAGKRWLRPPCSTALGAFISSRQRRRKDRRFRAS